GLAPVMANEADKWGYINKSGKFAIPPQFDLALCFSEGLASVKVNDKWGYINRTGTMVIEAKFVEADSFFDGLARVSIGGRDAYIDKAGNVVWKSTYQMQMEQRPSKK